MKVGEAPQYEIALHVAAKVSDCVTTSVFFLHLQFEGIHVKPRSHLQLQ